MFITLIISNAETRFSSLTNNECFITLTRQGMCCAFNKENAEIIFVQSRYSLALTDLEREEKANAFEVSDLPDWYIRCQFHQHFISTFCVDNLWIKNYKVKL